MKRSTITAIVYGAVVTVMVLNRVLPLHAQQIPDPAFLQKAIAALQQQRNGALDSQAEIAARSAMQADEIAKLQARITELEAKLPPKQGEQ
jgi:hypothetical protein